MTRTNGPPSAAYLKGGLNGDIKAILRPIQRGMLQFIGFDVLAPHIVYGPVRLEQAQREELLDEYAGRLRNIDKENPIEVGVY